MLLWRPLQSRSQPDDEGTLNAKHELALVGRSAEPCELFYCDAGRGFRFAPGRI